MDASWRLTGESISALVMWSSNGRLPDGINRVPGPSLVFALCARLPTGTHVEFSIGEPARVGARFGWCFTTMAVNNAAGADRAAGNPGFPAEKAPLAWEGQGDLRRLTWLERGLVLEGEATSAPLPWLVPLRALQRRRDGTVVVPATARGAGRLAKVTVTARPDDPLAGLAGDHRGITVDTLDVVRAPARLAHRLTLPLRAPLAPPEPAM